MRGIWISNIIILTLFKFFTNNIPLFLPCVMEAVDVVPNTPQLQSATIFPILQQLSSDIQNLWNSHKNSVVKVMGTQKKNNQEQLLFGTGFFADADGNILTSATIATAAEKLWIEYQGLSYAAIVVGKDILTNLAVIKVVKKPESFTPILLSETSQYVAAPEGSFIIAISCALGMESTPTLGLLSGSTINFGEHVFVTTYLRSDISMCGGESGAPVFNGDGSLCGVLIAALPELRSSFIIPECALGRIFNDIIKNKNVSYVSAGFSVRGQMSKINGKKEIVVSSVDISKIKYKGTETLNIGDRILKLEGQEIIKEGDIADILFFKRPNDDIRLDVMRNQKPLSTIIALDQKYF